MKKCVRRVVLIFVVVFVVFFSTNSTAQETGECPQRPVTKDDATALASEWFSKGTQLVEEQMYQAGSAAFKCSYTMVPHDASLLNAALAAEKAGDAPGACNLFLLYLEIASDGEKKEKVATTVEGLNCSREAGDDAVTSMGENNEGSGDGSENVVEGEGGTENDLGVTPRANTHTAGAASDRLVGPVANGHGQSKKKGEAMDTASTPISAPQLNFLGSVHRSGLVILTIGGLGVATGVLFQSLAGHEQKSANEAPEKDVYYEKKADMERFQAVAIAAFVSGGILFTTGLILALSAKRKIRSVESFAKKMNHWGIGTGVSFQSMF